MQLRGAERPGVTAPPLGSLCPALSPDFSGSKAQPAPPAPLGLRGSLRSPPHRSSCALLTPWHVQRRGQSWLWPRVRRCCRAGAWPGGRTGGSRGSASSAAGILCVPAAGGSVHLRTCRGAPAPVPGVAPPGDPATQLLRHGRVLATWVPRAPAGPWDTRAEAAAVPGAPGTLGHGAMARCAGAQVSLQQ